MPVPGVEGGVNAGDTKPGSSESEDSESCGWVFTTSAREGLEIDSAFKSSSEIARETGIGRGE